MKSNNEKLIKKLTSQVLKETLEGKVKNIEEKLGGMEDSHPRFGNKRLPMNMSREEIDAMFNEPIDSDKESVKDIKISNTNKKNPLGSPDKEMDEGFDSFEIKKARRGKDFEEDEFEEIPLGKISHSNLEDDSTTPNRFLYNKLRNLKRDLEDEDYDDELNEKTKDMCEQCGGRMNEGECTECGSKWMEEGIYDEDDIDNSNEFDYVQEETYSEDEENSNQSSDETCKYHKKTFGPNDERTIMACKGMNESLKGRQKLLDKNKNGRLDAADFKMLRAMKSKKSENKEGKKFPDLSGDGKITRKDILMGRGVKLGKSKKTVDEKWKGDVEVEKTGEHKDKSISQINSEIKKLKTKTSKVKKAGEKVSSEDKEKMGELYFAKRAKQGWKGKGKSKVNETIELTEEQLIDLIENVVIEQKNKKSNIKSSGTPKGLTKYQQVHSKDKKQNDDYLKSVAKKMKDYLKDGSKGKYEESPKHFPKGNGELAKMSKKAYVPSSAVKDYTDNLTAAGQENLKYDEINPNEEWLTDNIVGSSRTGNNPEWANTGESEVNKKRNEIRKKNLLGKIKQKAYNKAAQPIVTDKTGEDEGEKLLAKLESIEPKENKKINEEFDRMKQLLSYNKKTQ